jgi:transcriptional regulator with XRE-family HTH domain
MKIGQAITAFRKKKGLSQKELAARCGLSANALCSIEKGYSFPSKETIESICYSLDISVGMLLFSALDDNDVPPQKLEVFKALQKPLLELFGL